MAPVFLLFMLLFGSGAAVPCYECSDETECENPSREIFCSVCLAQYKGGKPHLMNCSSLSLQEIIDNGGDGAGLKSCPPKDLDSECTCLRNLCNNDRKPREEAKCGFTNCNPNLTKPNTDKSNGSGSTTSNIKNVYKSSLLVCGYLRWIGLFTYVYLVNGLQRLMTP